MAEGVPPYQPHHPLLLPLCSSLLGLQSRSLARNTPGLGDVPLARQCPPPPPRATSLPAGCLWLVPSGSGLPPAVPNQPGHPGPDLADLMHTKGLGQLCSSVGHQPAHQPPRLQPPCRAFPGCPGSFPAPGAGMGPLCPSKPLLLGTGWRTQGTLCPCPLCFFPPVVPSRFFFKEINGNIHRPTLCKA